MIRQTLKRWRLIIGQCLGGPGPRGVKIRAAMIKPYIAGSPFFEKREWDVASPGGPILRWVKRHPKVRWLQRFYATLAGYFWMPCPVCEEPYGGHEWEGDSLIIEREYFSDDPGDELFAQIKRTKSKGVCVGCGEAAHKLNERWGTR